MHDILESFDQRADRLINYGWLMAIIDLAKESPSSRQLAADMLKYNGFTREKVLEAGMQPYDVCSLLSLFPKPEQRAFVNGNHDTRTARVRLSGPRGVVVCRADLMAMRAVREGI